MMRFIWRNDAWQHHMIKDTGADPHDKFPELKRRMNECLYPNGRNEVWDRISALAGVDPETGQIVP